MGIAASQGSDSPRPGAPGKSVYADSWITGSFKYETGNEGRFCIRIGNPDKVVILMSLFSKVYNVCTVSNK